MTRAQGLEKPLNKTVLLVCVWVIFVGIGLFLGAIGPAVPDLARLTGSSVEAVGAIFSTVFFGALFAQLAAGQIMDRFGMRLLILFGIVLSAGAALALVNSVTLTTVLVLAAVVGIGHGAMDITSQVYIARIFGRDSLRALNSIHLFFGIGTVIGPTVASFALREVGSALPAIALAAVTPLLVLPILWFQLRELPRNAANESAIQPTTRSVYVSPLLWLFGLMMLVYVGFETGVGGWTTVYMTSTTGMVEADAALITSGYWLTFTLGRLAATLLAARFTAGQMLLGSVTISGLGVLLLMLNVGNMTLSIASTLLIGFGCAPVYALVISLSAGAFPHAAGRAASFAAAMGSLGGLSITPLQGVVLQRFGGAAMGGYLLVQTFIMLLLYVGIMALMQRHHEAKAKSELPEPVHG